MTAAAHFDSVKARLNADPVLSGKGFDGARLDAAGLPVRETYWILFGGLPDDLDDERLSSQQAADSDADYYYTVRSVSVTASGVLALAQKAQNQLDGWAPTVTGRACGAMVLDDGGQVEPDYAVNPPLFYLDAGYTLRSSRA